VRPKHLLLFAFGVALWSCAPAAAPNASAHSGPKTDTVLETSSATGGLATARDVGGVEPPGFVKHAIIITIDGLMPATYVEPDAHGLAVPTLRRLRAQGRSSDGALSVFPSLTYPAHTTIASGVRPARHGVVSNSAFDPLGQNMEAWRWYAADVTAPRVWDVAWAAGYRTALIDWPVTVGAEATLHVPEFWRARVPDDLKLISALSTPRDVLEKVAATSPTFRDGFRPQDVSDEAGFDIALYALEHVRPHLTFLHVWQVDAAQHKYGLFSQEARTAIEAADRQLGRLLEALVRLELSSKTALVVLSDHGFRDVDRAFNPRALLSKAGLLSLDRDGKVSHWKATVLPNHGSAAVYLKDPTDEKLKATVSKLFHDAATAYPTAIAKVFSQEEIAAMGGDPNAFLALEAAPGAYFGTDYQSWQTPPKYKANHGYDPNQPSMLASLLLFGAGVTPGKLEGAELVDVAPTVAAWLGLTMPNVEGRVLGQ
jgi:predicted AlkP superfamily pyrophosphatase or phosphodiesterase